MKTESETLLTATLKEIRPLDGKMGAAAQKKLDILTKPQGSLGMGR
jgi:NaMN:DMB phosphoribosyltransferase